MLAMSPRHVVVHEDLLADPRSAARVERLSRAVSNLPPLVVDDRALDAFVAERHYPSNRMWGERERPEDPDLYLIRERWDDDQERQRRSERYPHLRYRNLLGYGGVAYRRDGGAEWREQTGTVCQPAWELHSASGCPFRCAYCWFGDAISLKCNVEEQIDHLPDAFALAPNQAIWKWDNQTDLNCFEPEWGGIAPMIERFSRETDRWLLLYTGKSDNVDFMLDLEHGGQTVICWSLSPATQAERVEVRTAGSRERVEAAARCQRAGYAVRFRFSPIIPVNGWREEYRELIRHIFEVTRPDVISLCPFGWMDVPRAEAVLGPELLDPEALAAMRRDGRDADWPGTHSSPIPFDYRRRMLDTLIDEIQSHGAATRISICLDTPRMWSALGERIGQQPDKYFCNCGAHCRPRNVGAVS